MNTSNQNPYIIPGAVVVAALIIAAAIVYGPHGAPVAGNTNTVTPPATGAATAVNAKDIDTKGDPFVGKATAPVTIVYWSDYQCPFCKKFDTETLGKVVTNYVNTGKVRIVFKDFQFLGNDSFTMALAGRAVWAAYPDKYYAWREAIYQNEGQENSGYATQAFMDGIYKKVGIDAAKINALIVKNSTAYQAAIDADKQEGGKFGINGTPGIVAGNQKFSGAVAYSTFSAALDSQLK